MIVALVPAAVCSHPVPLKENQVASQPSRKLVLVVEEVVVQAARKVSPGNVSSLRIVHIRDSAIEFIRNECQWISIEAFLSGNFSMLNGASIHLEVSLVMSRDLRLNINDGPRGIAFLDDGWHDATNGVGG